MADRYSAAPCAAAASRHRTRLLFDRLPHELSENRAGDVGDRFDAAHPTPLPAVVGSRSVVSSFAADARLFARVRQAAVGEAWGCRSSDHDPADFHQPAKEQNAKTRQRNRAGATAALARLRNALPGRLFTGQAGAALARSGNHRRHTRRRAGEFIVRAAGNAGDRDLPDRAIQRHDLSGEEPDFRPWSIRLCLPSVRGTGRFCECRWRTWRRRWKSPSEKPLASWRRDAT